VTTVDDLATAVLAALRTDLGVTMRLDVFDGDVKALTDSDGRARPYAALYPSAGNLQSQSLCGTQEFLDWPFQVTAVGGDPARARRAIHRVRVRLSGVELSAAGTRFRVVEEPNYQPGPIREDRDVSPSRWFSPLQFRSQLMT
jgi:hypothetical protein